MDLWPCSICSSTDSSCGHREAEILAWAHNSQPTRLTLPEQPQRKPPTSETTDVKTKELAG
jgi:hypothetical protein